MNLTELFPGPRGFTGPWGCGTLILAPFADLGEFQGERFLWHTHTLNYAYPGNSVQIPIALGISRPCPRTGLSFVRSVIGSIPIVLETTRDDTILVRVGSRLDYQYPPTNYRFDKWPDPRILLGDRH